MIEFAQPAALWTGLAIGLPIVAHMAYRRVTEKFYFPSLRFIRPTQIPRTGKRTPSDIPLLLLRILLFLLLTALLADPFWKSTAVPASEDDGEEVIIAIDLSPSMAGWGGLQEAKEKALQLLNNESGKMGLLTFGQSILDQLDIGTDRESIRVKIEGLKNDWSRGNAQVMLDRLSNAFSDKATRRKLFIISDFQQSDWQTAYRDLHESKIEFKLVKVGQSSDSEGLRQNNLSVMEVRAVPAGPNKIRVWTVVRNWDDLNRTIEIELLAGGNQIGKNIVSVPPLGSVQTQFVMSEGDFSSSTIRLDVDDEFPLDNERTVWLKAPPSRKFGFWTPEQENDETDEEKSFLKTAVASSGDNGWNRWDWDQDKADGLRLGDDQLKVDFLMVLGLGKWFEEEQLGLTLTDFLSNGGVALITPGDLFSSTVSILKSEKLLSYNFVRVAGGAVQTRNPFRIGALAENSSLAEIFAGKSARDLYLSAIHRFGILKPVSGSEDIEVPLRDREGRPLALVKPFDSGGRLVFLPFRMNTTWTDLPLRSSFLPLLMELTQSKKMKSVSRAWPVLEPGQALSGTQGTFTATEPGAYRFEDQWIEVVLSPSEFIPDTFSLTALSDSLGGPQEGTVSRFKGLGSTEEDNHPLWMWFAMAASILLITEMLWSRPSQLPKNPINSVNA